MRFWALRMHDTNSVHQRTTTSFGWQISTSILTVAYSMDRSASHIARGLKCSPWIFQQRKRQENAMATATINMLYCVSAATGIDSGVNTALSNLAPRLPLSELGTDASS